MRKMFQYCKKWCKSSFWSEVVTHLTAWSFFIRIIPPKPWKMYKRWCLAQSSCCSFSKRWNKSPLKLSNVILALDLWKKSSLNILKYLLLNPQGKKTSFGTTFILSFLKIFSFPFFFSFLQTGFKRSRIPSRKAPDYSQR